MPWGCTDVALELHFLHGIPTWHVREALLCTRHKFGVLEHECLEVACAP